MSSDDVARSVLDRALDCAVDLVRDKPVPLPALPASGLVCSELGIGASTFYRLFSSVDEYRRQLIEHLLYVPYEAAEMPLLQALAALSGSTADSALVGLTPEAVVLRIVTSFADADLLDIAPEADWLPWIGNPTVSQWLDSSLDQAMSVELPAIVGVIASFGVTSIDGMSNTDFMKRQFALTIGLKLCGVANESWPTPGPSQRFAIASRYWLSLFTLDIDPESLETGLDETGPDEGR